MANRETYPASQSPLLGDVIGPAGATQVTVVGLQGNPVAPGGPDDQSVLTWDQDPTGSGEWVPKVPTWTFSVHGSPDALGNLQGFTIISDDWDVFINNIGTELLVGWAYGFAHQFFVNGTGIA